MEIIVKNWNHYNSALGCHVKNKEHYKELMRKGNYISQEEQSDRCKNNGKKEFVLSKDAEDIIRAAKSKRNYKGQVKLDGKLGDKMISMGIINKKIGNYMKVDGLNTQSGGFSLSDSQSSVYHSKEKVKGFSL